MALITRCFVCGAVVSLHGLVDSTRHYRAVGADFQAVAVPSRQVVVAKWKEDVSWLQRLPANFHVDVYQSTNQSAPHFVENVGNEAYKYVSYIIDNYDRLPDTVTFVQAGRQDFHDPQPKDVLLPKADGNAAAANGGFAFLPGTGTCWSVRLSARQEEEIPDVTCIDVGLTGDEELETLRRLWADVLQPELGAPPGKWRTACCAEFEVTREAIQRHPVVFWQRLAGWMRDQDRGLFGDSFIQERASSERSNPNALTQFLGVDTAGLVSKQSSNQRTSRSDQGSRSGHHDPLERDAGHVMELVWPLLFVDRRVNAQLDWLAP